MLVTSAAGGISLQLSFTWFHAISNESGRQTLQVYLSLLKKIVKWTWMNIKSHATGILCQIYRSENGSKVESTQECCRNVVCEDFSSLKFAKLFWSCFLKLRAPPGIVVCHISNLKWILLIPYLNKANWAKTDTAKRWHCTFITLFTYHSFLLLLKTSHEHSQRDRSWTGMVFSVSPHQFTEIVSVYDWAAALTGDNTICYKQIKNNWGCVCVLDCSLEQKKLPEQGSMKNALQHYKIFNYLTPSEFSLNIPKMANKSSYSVQVFLA